MTAIPTLSRSLTRRLGPRLAFGVLGSLVLSPALCAQYQNLTPRHRNPIVLVELPDLPGGALDARARGVSNDGLVVVGSGRSTASGSNSEGVLWTGGVTYALGDLPGSDYSSTARGVSADGRWIVGSSRAKHTGWHYGHWRACTWGPSGILQELPDLPGVGEEFTHAHAVSFDGSVMVGVSGSTASVNQWVAVRWTSAGAEALGWLPTNKRTAAYDVSADGTVIVGLASEGPNPYRGFRWTIDSGFLDLGATSTAEAVSDDGIWIVGKMPGGDAGRWSAATGWVSLGANFTPRGISANGEVVVGTMTGPGFGFAMIWTPAGGTRRLDTLVEVEWGQSLGGWRLKEAWDVSADGVHIVGRGVNPSGGKVGFRLEVRP